MATDVAGEGDGSGAAAAQAKKFEELQLADFTTGVTLGTGSFGRVRLAKHNADGSTWALKMLKKAEV